MSKKIKKLHLPHRYRNKVVEILERQGFELTKHDVSNVLRGHVTDPEKTAAVLAAVKKVSRAHQRVQKQRVALLGKP